MIIGRHRYKKRFFYALFTILTVALIVAMTIDFESRWDESHTQLYGEEIGEEEQVPHIAEKVAVKTHTTSGEALGEYIITHYCPCEKCCGKTDAITATGTVATADRTIAVDPSVIPYGTEVIIDGKTYVAEDCGGAIKGNRIDIFCDSHSEAINRGKITKEVFKVEY